LIAVSKVWRYVNTAPMCVIESLQEVMWKKIWVRGRIGHHQKYESMTKLFVCYHAVTALTERFCQNAFAPREAMAAGSRACHLRVQLDRRPIAPANSTL
jgi:hypothetical protein